MTDTEFHEIIRPIVSSCSGFIKTDGYMVYLRGILLIMDPDAMYFGIIRGLPLFEKTVIGKINTFLSLKDPIDLSNLYFLGWNQVFDQMCSYLETYWHIDGYFDCVYSEPDCNNIEGFKEANSSSEIKHIIVSDGNNYYRIPMSKAITTATKSDTVSLLIYKPIFNDLSKENRRTVEYCIWKKKFNLRIDLFTNILV